MTSSSGATYSRVTRKVECPVPWGGFDALALGERFHFSTLPLATQMANGGVPVFQGSVRPRSHGAAWDCRRLERKAMATHRQQVLLVDDDAIVQEVLTLFLRDAYQVGHATTGIDALAKFRREPVDLVVLDHRLPDRTGLDLLIELKSIRSNVPVIMLTGYGSEWICAAAFKRGVADYFTKPVSAADLVAAVRRILDPASKRPCEVPVPIEPAPPLCIPVQKALGVIQQRYWDQFSLSELAREVGMSKYRLSHRFREVLGVTIRDCLLQVRLERAKALLAAGHVSMTELAQIVGFGDLSRFDKVFRKHTGSSPSAYRKARIAAATRAKK